MKSTLTTWLLIGIGVGGLIWLNDRPSKPATEQVTSEAGHPNQEQSSAAASVPSSSPRDTTGTQQPVKHDVNRDSISSPPTVGPRAGGTGDEEPIDEVSTTHPDSEDDPQEENPGGVLGRVLGEHFSSHPSTQKRILHLRSLDTKNGTQPSTAKPKEGIDLLIDVKNRLARAGSEVMTEVVGPLSVKDEWAIGAKVHHQLVESMEIDHQATRRVENLIAPLLTQLKRTREMPYRVTVIQDKTVNAFAHLGGHLYVYTGLLDLFENDQQLMFVLGHEIAHIELAQCAKASLPGIAAERMLGTVGKLPADLMNKLVHLSFSEENELDADVWSYRRLRALNYNDEEIFAFFTLMLKHEHDQANKSK